MGRNKQIANDKEGDDDGFLATATAEEKEEEQQCFNDTSEK